MATLRLFTIAATGVLALALTACGASAGPDSTGSGVNNPVELDAALPAALESRGEIRIAVKCDSPGFGFKKSGEVVGYEADIARQLGAYAFGDENAAKLECVTADNRVPYLNSGRVDLVLATLGITQDRAEVITFSEPYMASLGQFLTLEGNSFDSLDELERTRVVTDAGAPWIDWIKKCVPSSEVVTLSGEATQLQALRNSKVDAVLEDSTLLINVVSKSEDFEITGPYLPQLGFAWGAGMKLGDAELESWVNAAFAEMQKEDFFWDSITKAMPDTDVQKAVEASVRRPDSTPAYEDYLFSYLPAGAEVPCA